MLRQRLYVLWVVLALVPIPTIWCILFATDSLDVARNWSMDWRYRARGEIESPAKVVYVDIDSRSLADIGGWPWSRHYLAVVAQTLIEQAGVKVVGIDVVLSDLGLSESVDLQKLVNGNVEFARYLINDPPVVLAAAFSAAEFRDINNELATRHLPLVATETRAIENIAEPEKPTFNIGRAFPWSPAGIGLIDTKDAGTRWVPLYAPTAVQTYRHMAVEMLRRYWELGLEDVVIANDHLDFVGPDGNVIRRVPLTDQQLLEVNWHSHWLSSLNPRISFVDVYAYALNLQDTENPEAVESARAFFDQDAFKDALVLIGPVDPLMQDTADTPYDREVPKVGVHGNVIKTIVGGRFIRRLEPFQIYLIVFGLTLVVVVSATASGTRSVGGILGGIALAGSYVYFVFHMFSNNDLALPLVAPVGSAFTTTLAAMSWQYLREQKAKGRIKGMFGTYLAPAVVDTMIDSGRDPELGGHDAEITPYFSDIQSFSSFSEVLTSSQLGELLNEYLTACTDIVQAQGGTLDKYIGDAVVAMFGAPVDLPDHTYKACLTSLLVQEELGRLREKWAREGDKWPPMVHKMRNRIGLNTGLCMIGNMGSRTRFNYTMMGDNVNLAARMESGAKSWGAFTMVTQSTRNGCEKHGGDHIVFRPLGRIVVQGRSQPVPIHEVVALRENMTDAHWECLDLFAQGMKCYYNRDWQGAADCFKRSAPLEPLTPERDAGVKSNPSLVYQRIIAETAANPPPDDWDGVYLMTEK